MEFLKRLKKMFTQKLSYEVVSEQWLKQNIYSEGTKGWLDAPRWKFPKELKEEKQRANNENKRHKLRRVS